MGWKFWQKADDPAAPKVKKLPKQGNLQRVIDNLVRSITKELGSR